VAAPGGLRAGGLPAQAPDGPACACFDPKCPEGLARRRVAKAFAASVVVVDADAPLLCRTSHLALEANAAAQAGRRNQPAWLRLSAFAQQPSRDLARSAAQDLFGVRDPIQRLD